MDAGRIIRDVLVDLFGPEGANTEYRTQRSSLDPKRLVEVHLNAGTIPPAPTDELKIFATRPHPFLVFDLEEKKVYEGDPHLEHNIERGESIKPLTSLPE